MRGSNTMLLNEATMIKALQHYFDTVLFNHENSPEIKGVSYTSTHGVPPFQISIAERKDNATS